jgi:hypothetical protein
LNWGEEVVTTGKNQQLIESLQENVSSFFARFRHKHADKMKCARGCAKCCRVHLNVFPIEAERILQWWRSRSLEERNILAQLWKDDLGSQAEHLKCTFLVNDCCSVYDARPVICRSQGLPLKVKSLVETDSDSENFELSLCELNFVENDSIPDVGEWMDLERLNTLLAIAQQQSSEISTEISDIAKREQGRVPLSRLKALLLQIMD